MNKMVYWPRHLATFRFNNCITSKICINILKVVNTKFGIFGNVLN